MTVHAVEHDLKPTHRSFRLTRPGREQHAEQVAPTLVLPERDVRAIAATAARQDVSRGGCFSAGPAGVQIWSGPWDGPLGGRGDAVHLGSVDWSFDTPVMQYATVYRVLVTVRGLERGESTDTVLARALALAGLSAPGSRAEGGPRVPPPRDPFRPDSLRQRP